MQILPRTALTQKKYIVRWNSFIFIQFFHPEMCERRHFLWMVTMEHIYIFFVLLEHWDKKEEKTLNFKTLYVSWNIFGLLFLYFVVFMLFDFYKKGSDSFLFLVVPLYINNYRMVYTSMFITTFCNLEIRHVFFLNVPSAEKKNKI